MATNSLVGSTEQIYINVYDPADPTTPIDASDVDLVVIDPSGNQTTEVPNHPDTGYYTFFLQVDEPGYFTANWTVTVGSLVKVIECEVCGIASVVAA